MTEMIKKATLAVLILASAIAAKAAGTTQLVPANDPHLRGYHASYEPATDTIYINRDHPVPECIEILEAHEEIHRQQFARGEDIHSRRAEREARDGSMSRSCSEAGRPPVFPMAFAIRVEP